jgi:hypothetical protein
MFAHKKTSKGSTTRPTRLRIAYWGLISAAALLACAGSVHMDVRSRSEPETWGIADNYLVELFSTGGTTILYAGPWGIKDAQYRHWQKLDVEARPLDGPERWWSIAGIAVGRAKIAPERSLQIEVPYWFWTAILAVLAALSARRCFRLRRRARAAARGLCVVCGYDLRGQPASSSRCPECGTPSTSTDAGSV